MAASALHRGFSLGERIRVWPGLLEIECGARRERVEPRMMDVLVALAAAAPAPLTRDELMAQVWAGRIVTEDSLNRIVSRLRAVLDDDPREPCVIDTIPRRGYRLLLTAQPLPPAPPDAADAFAPEPTAAAATPAEPTEAPPASSPPRRRRSRLAAPALLVLALLALGSVSWIAMRPGTPPPPASAPVPRVGVLTAYPGRESYVAFHPAGREFVFTWDGEEAGNRDLYRRALDGGTPQRLTRDPGIDRAAVYAPDGERLAFVRAQGDDCRVLLLDLRSGEERVLATCTSIAQPRLSFSPTGDRLVFNDNPGMQGQRLVELRLHDLTRRDVTAPPAGEQDYFPAFSPDGRWLAFGRTVGIGLQDLYRISTRGGAPQRLTAQGGALSGVAYAPDGSIVYVSDAAGENGLWQVRADAAPRWLGLSGGVQFPALTRDGRWLAFERVRIESRLVFARRDAPGEVEREVLASTRQDWYPDCTADARTVVFASNRSGQFGLWRIDADEAAPRALREGLGLVPFSASIAPDGRDAIYAETRAGETQICRVALHDGAHHCLVTSPGADVQPSYRPEGDGFVFASARDGTYRLYRADRDGGNVRRLSDTPAVAPRALAGDRILFMQLGRAGLWLREADGRERELHPDLPAVAYRNFDGDGERAWLVDARGHLIEVDLAGDASRDLGALPAIDARSGLRWCPGAQRFVYARLERDDIDLDRVEDAIDAAP